MQIKVFAFTLWLPILLLCLTAVAGALETPNGWSVEATRDLGVQATVLREPGPKESASLMGEFTFQLPSQQVDVQKLADGLIQSLGIKIVQKLPSAFPDEIYHTSFLAHNVGKPTPIFRADFIAFSEVDEQRILLISTMPERFEAMGGLDSLLNTFGHAKTLEKLVNAEAKRREILDRWPDEHVIATSSSGEKMRFAEFKTVVAVTEYMVGQRLSPKHLQSLLDAAQPEWEQDPDTSEFKTIRDFLAQVKTYDPVQQIDTAVLLYAGAHRAHQASREKSTVMDLAYQLNPIVETKGDQILTKRALDARVRSGQYVMTLQGSNIEEVQRSESSLRKEVIQAFKAESDRNRIAIQNSQSRWFRLQADFSNKTPKQRMEALKNATLLAQNNRTPTRITLELEHKLSDMDNLLQATEAIIFGGVVIPAFTQ